MASYALGACYLKGYGVQISKDKAIKFFKKGVAGGSKQSCIRLYFILKDSQYEDALQYLAIAARNNDPTALFLLGAECELNYAIDEAYEYYQKAACLGEPHAIKKITKGKEK